MRNYVPSDVISRYMRMRGYDVLHPMGWDAFGLPTENDAIKRGRHPEDLTAEYTANYKRQMDLAGLSYDWDREINSTDPEYYRWTQWVFLELYKRGLAYRATGMQWWCPVCGALANEEVNADGTDWRGHGNITRRKLTQWFFKITAYADELLSSLDELDWPEETKRMQENWIGRSEGADVIFKTEAGPELSVFTTRPDTLFGTTFMVLAPEHPLLSKVITPEHETEVQAYVEAATRKSDMDRTALDRTKTGVFTGGYALNPINDERVPIWVADYVVMTYGSGAVMAVPAHDQRDFEFANTYGLEIRMAIAPPGWDRAPIAEAFIDDGVMVNSGELDGLPASEGLRAVTEWLERNDAGGAAVNYKLRDWLISRQRYWGTPVPIVHCDECGEVPVPENQLPVRLPEVAELNPDKLSGRSPLEAVEDWVATTCPTCDGAARRETDTLGGFACSSWYFLRFCSPHETEQAFDPEAIKHWMPVNLYVGGAEHAVMHLLYARFWTKALRDAGYLDFGEPFQKLRHQGIMLSQPGWVCEETLWIDSANTALVTNEAGADAYEGPGPPSRLMSTYPHEAKFVLTGNRQESSGSTWVEYRAKRMSKSMNNVVTPDDVIRRAGTDAMRCYVQFMGPFERTLPWSEQGLVGMSRWLQRVWNLVLNQPVGGTYRSVAKTDDVPTELRRRTHRLVRKVTTDLENMRFNTSIAAMMEFTNFLIAVGNEDVRDSVEWHEAIDTFLVVLAPTACFITEELWGRTGHPGSVHEQSWPNWDADLAFEDTFTLVVQVNGKVRDRVNAPTGLDEATARELALASERVKHHLNGRIVQRTIYRSGRLINLVAR
jgi:leucyl-tRNA synthetase